MADHRIIVPGAEPPSAPSPLDKKAGSLTFDVNGDNAVKLSPVFALKGQHAIDAIRGNPDHRPFVVAIPYLESRLTIHTDLKHDIVFMRGAQGHEVGLYAVSMWEKYIKPRFRLPSAEASGSPIAQALDERDAAELWLAAARQNRNAPDKYPLVAMGSPHIPYFFCLIGEDFQFGSLKSAEGHESKLSRLKF